jgi:predicted ATPase/class 3 adenylate cyclase
VRQTDVVAMPSGVVTLLFTDIEGSTRAWERSPAGMQTSLARHDEIVRGLIESSGGYVFATAGDAFCAAFSEATEALTVAMSIQRSLWSEAWTASAEIKVRISLHSGMCLQRDGNYFGPTVNRVARILSTAHGGQVLASKSTVALIEDGIPAGVTFSDLGEHRLRDLAHPEQIFQVCVPDLPQDFPPIASLDNPQLRHNLPAQASSFIGRNKEFEEVRDLLRDARAVTLVGAGGAGKTRLALHVAEAMLDGTGDGVWFVDLSPLSDPSLVEKTAADVFGIREELGMDLDESLATSLKEKELLLVLDNCEHVIGPAAKLVQRLIESCPKVVVLATSREPLAVAGEHLYRVPPLSLPETEEFESEGTRMSEAVELFLERANEQKPEMTFDEKSMDSIRTLCMRLDGLPLAIELAVARLRMLSVEDIEARLDQRFTLLTSGPRTALPRHQTLGAMIDWSYELLIPPEQAVLRRLSVFAGGFDLVAAEAVTQGGDVDELSVMHHLSSLVDKSLVQVEGVHRIRYRLLETVRQYAAGKLDETSAGATVRNRHRDHYLRLAELAHPEFVSADQAEWYGRIESEHDNLRLALSTCMADADPSGGLRLAFALYPFYNNRGHGAEGAKVLRALLERPESRKHPVLRGRALTAAAFLLGLILGDVSLASDYVAEALTIGQEQQDNLTAAQSFRLLAAFSNIRAEFGAALLQTDKGMAIPLSISDKVEAHTKATLHMERGMALASLGRSAHSDYSEALELLRRNGNRLAVGLMLINVSNIEIAEGDFEAAKGHLEQSIALARELGSGGGIYNSLNGLGLIAFYEGDDLRSREMFSEALKLAYDEGQAFAIVSAMLGLTVLTTRAGDLGLAAKLHGAIDAYCERTSQTIHDEDLKLKNADQAFLRQQLGNGEFEERVALGMQMTIEHGVSSALAQQWPLSKTNV